MQQAEWEAMGKEKTEADAYIEDVKSAIERMRRAVADKERDIEVLHDRPLQLSLCRYYYSVC